MKLLAIDTETTGLDIRHGCRPFFVTMCFDDWSQAHWEWDVDPLTRRVLADRNDLLEIAGLLGEAEEVVGQNIKFDVGALTYLFRDHSIDFRWPWDRTHDTLIAGHTLHSSEPHDLTSMLLLYTRKADIKLLEDALEQRTQECRRIVQQAVLRVKRHALKVARAGQPAAAAAVREPPPGRPRPKPKGPQLRSWRPPTKAELKAEEELRLAQVFRGWKITTEDDPLLPSAGGRGMWRGDGWLPRAVALYRWSVLKDPAYDPSLPVDRRHPYWDVLAHYGNADSAATLIIWLHQVRELKDKHIWPHYLVRRHSSSLAYRMEDHGVSCSLDRQATIKAEYEQASLEAGEECVAIARARGYDLTLPKSGVNDSLSEFCYGRILNVNGVKDPGLRVAIPEALMLPVKARSEKTGAPSLDKDVLAAYEVELEPDTDALRFVKALRAKRKRDKALENLATYERFWLPWVPAYPGSTDPQTGAGWYVLHPQLNPTGTSTLRWSSNNPNEQNICFSGDTECLTPAGWVRADQLRDNQVLAQYEKDSGEISFVRADVHRPAYDGHLVHLTTDENIDLLLTPMHRCLLRDRKTGAASDVHARDFKEDYHHLHAGFYKQGTVELSSAEVAWICAVQADGHYCVTDGEDYGIRFVLRKRRKIDRLRWCLGALGAQWTEKEDGRQVSFHVGKHQECVRQARQLMPDKKFGPWLLKLDRTTLDLFCDEVFLWDGDSTRLACWSSSDRVSADWVQTVFALSGWKANLASRRPSSPWAVSDHHYVNVTRRDYSLTTNFQSEQVYHRGNVYCVTVPSSYVLVRRNGKVAVTGNSKQEGFNLRYVFGPLPGREWWAFDAKNIELRIPAYEAGEAEKIALFERPDAPPYYGSDHILNFSIVFPEVWEAAVKEVGLDQAGPYCKKKYASTYYQWVKNGDFAVQYGAIDKPDGTGTADRAFHRPGGHALLNAKFSRLKTLNQKWIDFANRHGYVETLPDRTVDPKRGCPIECGRTEWKKILPTVPLNYHVQSTACWWMLRAMILVQQQLDEWRAGPNPFDGHMVLQVHDELVLDFPKSRVHPREDYDPGRKDKMKLFRRSNLWRARTIQQLMASVGEDLIPRVPTPVGVEYHEVSYDEGVSL